MRVCDWIVRAIFNHGKAMVNNSIDIVLRIGLIQEMCAHMHPNSVVSGNLKFLCFNIIVITKYRVPTAP